MEKLSDWVALVPLLALAGSAVAYVINLYATAAEKRRQRLFDLMAIIDSASPIASKMAAIYQLRQFPKHREFIIRFCNSQQSNIVGAGAQILAEEMRQTCNHMAALKR